MVAHKVSRDGLPGAGLRHHLIGHRDPVSGVVEVQEYDIKHQGCLETEGQGEVEEKKWDWSGARDEGEDDMNHKHAPCRSSSDHGRGQFLITNKYPLNGP